MKLFRISHDEHLEVIPERSYRDREVADGEAALQRILVDHPEVIPGEQIDPGDPTSWLLIKAEAGVTAGSMDILLVDHKGIPTVVETKLIDNREIRRSVLAQGLEYLAHLQQEWTAEEIVEEGRRFWSEKRSENIEAAANKVGITLERDFIDKISANLVNGKMRLVVAADKIPQELRTVLQFLNKSSAFDVYGLEVRFFAIGKGSDRILAPHAIMNMLILPTTWPQPDHILVQSLAVDLQSRVGFQFTSAGGTQRERKQSRIACDRPQRRRTGAVGNKGCLNEPGKQFCVAYLMNLRSLIDTFLIRVLKHAPIKEAAQHASGSSSHCLTFAELFSYSPLHLGGHDGTLQC